MNSIFKLLGAENTNTRMNLNNINNKLGGETKLEDAVVGIINAVIGILALVCVIIIIAGGVNYMTSAGDAAKVKKAKDTILYGVIGMVICILAFAITNFVISNVLRAAG